MLGEYLKLTKPGVMLGNLITTVAGFLFAANGHIDWALFLATNIGTCLVISSACVINNVLDQDIDAKMERTKTRPLITGEANSVVASVFGILIGLAGIAVLAAWTNWWVVGVGLFGFVTYVWLYGAFGKRRSMHGTLVGSLSGAAPILAGYVAVKPGLDPAGILLFLILFFWQEPEFYSIAIYRRKEYKAAGIPVISVARSVDYARNAILLYTTLCVAAILGLSVYGHTGLAYTGVMGLLGLLWIKHSVSGLSAAHVNTWAKSMFRFSLIVLLAFCLMISLNAWLP